MDDQLLVCFGRRDQFPASIADDSEGIITLVRSKGEIPSWLRPLIGVKPKKSSGKPKWISLPSKRQPQAFLDHCKAVARDDSDQKWSEEDLSGFFQRFRPSGEGIDRVFEGVPQSDQIIKRLINMYEATARGSEQDLYFNVRCADKATTDELHELTSRVLLNWRRMAESINNEELAKLLDPVPPITVVHAEPPKHDPGEEGNSLDSLIYEVHSDWTCFAIQPLSFHADLLREAFYYIACDYYLSGYLTWPWYQYQQTSDKYQSSLNMEEPYQPYFELWKHGAEIRFESPRSINVYCPTR